MEDKDKITVNKDVEDFNKAVEDITNRINLPNEEDSDEVVEEQLTGLAGFVKDAYKKSDTARTEIEQRWLESLRQYKGIYPPAILSKMNPYRSKAFVRMTRTKVRTVDSRLADLLFPADGDKNWTIEHTPVPEFDSKKTAGILNLYKQQFGKDITRDQLDQLMIDEAKRKASAMSRVIEDELVELKYREIMRNVIHSGNVYGTGVLKGPLVSITEDKQYYKQIESDGKYTWILNEQDKITPFIEYVRVWDIYPDMDTDSLDTCRFVIQRRKMDKHQVIGLSKRSDFSKDVITNYLVENPDGDYQKKDFEVELSSLGDVNDSASSSENMSKKYEVLEFWGFVDAEDLISVGVDVPEDKKGQLELAANIWLLGDKVIKASLAPMEGVKWPYYFYYYDKDETSIFGEGIPDIMRDVQELINSAFRAMLDNAAISAGPQVEVNLNLLSEDEDPREFYPFKVWLRTGEGPDASAPAIRQLQFQSYTGEFEKMIELFRSYGDEVTSIPRHMWGEATGSSARTASGLSMLMGSANITIKDQVKNFDDGITRPFITAMYHWNMQFSTNEDVKGDYTIVARGTSSLIAKEVRSQSLMTFAQLTANPVDMEIVKRPNIIRSIADSLDLIDQNLVNTDKEIAANKQAAEQAAQEERQWMNEMVEAAREEGISPTALLDSLRMLRKEMDEPAQQPEGAPEGQQYVEQ